MKKYRKRPVVVEAMQFTEDNREEVEKFIGDRLPYSLSYDHGFSRKINTLEGPVDLKPGDYVIKGVKGEFYPCRPDIFEMTYEPVDEIVGRDSNRIVELEERTGAAEYNFGIEHEALKKAEAELEDIRNTAAEQSALYHRAQDQVYKLEKELRKLREQYNREREVYLEEDNTLVVLEDPDFDEAIIAGEKNCVVKLVDADEWNYIADSYPKYVRIGISGPRRSTSGPVRRITWMGSVGSVMDKLIVEVCFASWNR